jgi:hypothetical protein
MGWDAMDLSFLSRSVSMIAGERSTDGEPGVGEQIIADGRPISGRDLFSDGQAGVVGMERDGDAVLLVSIGQGAAKPVDSQVTYRSRWEGVLSAVQPNGSLTPLGTLGPSSGLTFLAHVDGSLADGEASNHPRNALFRFTRTRRPSVPLTPICSPSCSGKVCGALDGCGNACSSGSGCSCAPTASYSVLNPPYGIRLSYGSAIDSGDFGCPGAGILAYIAWYSFDPNGCPGGPNGGSLLGGTPPPSSCVWAGAKSALDPAQYWDFPTATEAYWWVSVLYNDANLFFSYAGHP